MPYVVRTNGVVTGLFRWPNPHTEPEPLPDDHEDVMAFLAAFSSVAVVTPAQAKIAVARAGHWDAVTAELAKPENLEARIYWDSASEFRRDNPYIAALGAAIGLTDAEIDALFEAAKSL